MASLESLESLELKVLGLYFLIWKMDENGTPLQGTLVNISYRAAHGWVYAGPVAPFCSMGMGRYIKPGTLFKTNTIKSVIPVIVIAISSRNCILPEGIQ